MTATDLCLDCTGTGLPTLEGRCIACWRDVARARPAILPVTHGEPRVWLTRTIAVRPDVVGGVIVSKGGYTILLGDRTIDIANKDMLEAGHAFLLAGHPDVRQPQKP